MPNYTLTYSEGVQGWPSFYSFEPEWMIGMNQFFYTFKGGNLWRHNVNPLRNNYYGVNYPSTITSVFNDMPLQTKVFKTINLEADDAWDAALITDIQTTGRIDAAWFNKKEQSWFGFIRSDGPVGASTNETQWELRSLNGISQSLSVGGAANAYEINFALSIDLGSIISVGDYLYYALPPYTTPVFAGEVTQVLADKRNGINRIVIDSTSVVGTTNPIPITDAYFLYIKNPIAESHGLLGHYCEFTLTLNTTDPSELFAVEADLMKSFP